MADSPRTPQTSAPPPTAAALQLLLNALRRYEPDIADSIVLHFIHRTPQHRVLLLLHSPKFRKLQAAVKALPHGWRHSTATTVAPSIQQRYRTILDHIPHDLLALIPEIVLPPAHLVRVECRPRHRPLPPVPAGIHPPYIQLVSAWQTLRKAARPEAFPIAELDARRPRFEHRHIPLPHNDLVKYWCDPRHAVPNYTPLFDSLFPTDVGRSLYAAGAFLKHDSQHPQPHAMVQHRLSKHAWDYNKIKKVNTPYSPQVAKAKLARESRLLAIIQEIQT